MASFGLLEDSVALCGRLIALLRMKISGGNWEPVSDNGGILGVSRAAGELEATSY